MIVGIMQPNYLPWLGYFDMVACSDVFVLYDDVQFDKEGWRNRNRIAGGTKPLWLTAPVITAGRLGQRIRDTRLAEGPWQAKHLKTLRQTYARARHFDWCYPALDSYLRKRRYEFLLDLCLEGHRALCGLFAIDTPLRLSSDIGYQDAGRTGRLVAICRDLGATRYLSASASRAYMDEAQWRAARMDLRYQDYVHPVYDQGGVAFVSHLSAVDALMHVGAGARDLVGTSLQAVRGSPAQGG